METIASTPATQAVRAPLSLSMSDTCDPCGDSWTQALVAVRLLSGSDLYFCGHHYHHHEAALRSKIEHVIDTRPAGTRAPIPAVL